MRLFEGDIEKSVRQFQRGCAEINRLFYDLSREGVMEYRDHWLKGTTAGNIEKVATDRHPRRKFRRILECVDTNDTVQVQAALLLRAFSGLQMFPDANHRTGLVFVGYFLDQAGYTLECDLNDVVALVEDIRPEKGPYSARRTAGRLAERDASFERVLTFMNRFIRRQPLWQRIIPRPVSGRLRRAASKLPLHGMHVPEDTAAEMARKRPEK